MYMEIIQRLAFVYALKTKPAGLEDVGIVGFGTSHS